MRPIPLLQHMTRPIVRRTVVRAAARRRLGGLAPYRRRVGPKETWGVVCMPRSAWAFMTERRQHGSEALSTPPGRMIDIRT